MTAAIHLRCQPLDQLTQQILDTPDALLHALELQPHIHLHVQHGGNEIALCQRGRGLPQPRIVRVRCGCSRAGHLDLSFPLQRQITLLDASNSCCSACRAASTAACCSGTSCRGCCCGRGCGGSAAINNHTAVPAGWRRVHLATLVDGVLAGERGLASLQLGSLGEYLRGDVFNGCIAEDAEVDSWTD